ncbi:hypothetical protein CAPTEDRAFT_209259 [Capitella teleta]|uniref:Uncharacterized protein n=1 Tax=Capitella teleta TaxID=283909 RepID=R7U7N0_CAPTE|nr:hypothetical protein CAPTEDRAFT_209259 [Capitella teleta]|eukprot:ELU02156.1 hypothetical protein CAPTEDRAFT_209259 [Capitella teleta]
MATSMADAERIKHYYNTYDMDDKKIVTLSLRREDRGALSLMVFFKVHSLPDTEIKRKHYVSANYQQTMLTPRSVSVLLIFISCRGPFGGQWSGQTRVEGKDFHDMPTSFVTIIGGAIAVAFLLAFVIVTIWIYHRKHPSTPPRRHGSRSSLASQASLGTQISHRSHTPTQNRRLIVNQCAVAEFGQHSD